MKHHPSPTEQRVLELLLQDHSYERISKKLNIGTDAVASATGRLRRKLNVRSDCQLAARATRFGLVAVELGNKQIPTVDHKELQKIMSLPLSFLDEKIRRNERQLLIATKYARNYLHIDEFVLERFLALYPDYIRCWQIWRRRNWNEGWYMQMERPLLFSVGILMNGKEYPVFYFDSETKASAVFIKRELERIRVL